MNPFNASGWPNLWENPEIAREIASDNEEFAKEKASATPEWTEQLKQSVLESLYWVSQNTDKLQETQETSLEQKEATIRLNKYFPTIDSLNKNELISLHEYSLIIDYLYENINSKNTPNFSKIDWLNNFQLIEDYIDKVDSTDALESNNSHQKDMFTDFPEFEEKIQNKNWFDEAIFSIIWRNYIKIEHGNISSAEANEITLLTAIETSTNKINTIAKNIPKDSQTYLNAIDNIFSWDVEKALDGFESFYWLVFSHEWISWAGMEKWKKALQQSLEKRLDYIKQRIEILEHQIDLWKMTQRELQLKIEQLANLETEKEEIESWDIFQAWEIDKFSENLNEQKEAD